MNDIARNANAAIRERVARGITEEVSAELRADIAKRKAELLEPNVDITLDCGALGELTLTVRYEGIPAEPRDRYQPARDAYLIVMSVFLFGVDIIEHLDQDTINGIAEKVEQQLRREG